MEELDGRAVLISYRIITDLEKWVGAVRLRTGEDGEAAAVLFCSLMSNYLAAVTLAENSLGACSGQLVRSMIETLAHLRVLTNSPDHLRQMDFNDALKTVSTFAGVVAAGSDVWQTDSELQAFHTLLESHTIAAEEVLAFKAEGRKRQDVKGLLEAAALPPTTIMMYGHFCGFTHGQKSHLHHLHKSGSNISLWPVEDPKMVFTALHVGLSVMVSALRLLPRWTELVPAEIESLVGVMTKLWSDEVVVFSP